LIIDGKTGVPVSIPIITPSKEKSGHDYAVSRFSFLYTTPIFNNDLLWKKRKKLVGIFKQFQLFYNRQKKVRYKPTALNGKDNNSGG
jgi:hypothetical protein